MLNFLWNILTRSACQALPPQQILNQQVKNLRRSDKVVREQLKDIGCYGPAQDFYILTGTNKDGSSIAIQISENRLDIVVDPEQVESFTALGVDLKKYIALAHTHFLAGLTVELTIN